MPKTDLVDKLAVDHLRAEARASADVGPPPKISVGLPVYNGERYLAESVESVLVQTFTDFELIIVDNASADRTEEMARAYAAADPRIRYFRNAINVGSARNFSLAFKLARGEYFKWLSVDDLMAPECLERCLDALVSHPGAVLAYSRAVGIDADGVQRMRSEHPVDFDAQSDPIARFRSFREERPLSRMRAWPMLYIFGLIPASILRRTHLMPPYINSDGNLVQELVLAGRFVEVPDYLMSFRHHPGAYSHFASDDKKRRTYFDPLNEPSLLAFLGHRRLYFEYVLSIWRAKLSLWQKLSLSVYNVSWPRRRRRIEDVDRQEALITP